MPFTFSDNQGMVVSGNKNDLVIQMFIKYIAITD